MSTAESLKSTAAENYAQAEKALECLASEIRDIINDIDRRLIEAIDPSTIEAEKKQSGIFYSVIDIINDIRDFLFTAVESGIYIPVMFKNQDDSNPYISRAKEILTAFNVDYKDVDILDFQTLSDFIEAIATAKRYFADLIVNGKRIQNIRPVSGRIMHGEGKGVLILTDVEGKDSVLKFIAEDKMTKQRDMDDFSASFGDQSNKHPFSIDHKSSKYLLDREFEVLGSLASIDGVPQTHCKGVIKTDDGKRIYYTVTEFFDGTRLDQLNLDANNSFERIINIIRSLLSVLGNIHNKGYTHQDVSGTNILVSSDDQIKIVDFGSSMKTGRSVRKKDITTMGTFPYIPPDFTGYGDFAKLFSELLIMVAKDLGLLPSILQKMAVDDYLRFINFVTHEDITVEEDEDGYEVEHVTQHSLGEYLYSIFRKYYSPSNPVYDERKDLYAVGVLLCQMVITAGGNFKSARNFIDDKEDYLTCICQGNCSVLASQSPQTRQRLADIIRKATKLDYKERYSSAEEMLADIGKLLA